ncbi:hypothetical protein FHS72_003368 [Loktanella ponticola]|uniref:DUF998 domain-containing protein n=1 Tax=Yoonia ponticola TaxID=1524255 RepID=A0A7W9BNG0_9RHOB|nr:hypothetical protein [Yoonia ponticola]MBB5723723.1 hypothetical protein [Yoonia ponticola]
MPKQHHTDLVLSFTRVRTALGLLGMCLPLFLILGGLLDLPRVDSEVGRIEPTISDFYHTTYRDIFVGTLCAIGVFLISYRGYRREEGEWIDDDWLATTAGISAFGVAFFPNEGGGVKVASMTQHLLGAEFTPIIHYLSAFVFFSSLAAFCFVKFARTCSMGRRRVYIACGWTIIAALILTALAVVFKRFIGGTGREIVLDYNLIFWFEAMGIWAFGLSWLTKSKADLALFRKSGFAVGDTPRLGGCDDEQVG